MPEKMMRTVLRPRQQHDDAAIRADELLALSYQAAASVLTKLGKADLAWIAAERGLTAVHVCRQALCDRWPWCGPRKGSCAGHHPACLPRGCLHGLRTVC